MGGQCTKTNDGQDNNCLEGQGNSRVVWGLGRPDGEQLWGQVEAGREGQASLGWFVGPMMERGGRTNVR